MELLRDVFHAVLAGEGATLVLAGEPGLGKTRLVSECRRLFMTWVGAASGRLPLWLEGRAASYAASAPFGLYRHVLGSWVGAAPDEPEETVHAALGRAMKALFRDEPSHVQMQLLSKVMLGWSRENDATVGLTAEQTQRAIFEALRDVVSRLVAHGPTAVVLEDRMGRPARQVLVAASVLGAEFSLSSLASLRPVDEELMRTLADLSTAGLITELVGSADPLTGSAMRSSRRRPTKDFCGKSAASSMAKWPGRWRNPRATAAKKSPVYLGTISRRQVRLTGLVTTLNGQATVPRRCLPTKRR